MRVVARYGEFVRYRPSLSGATLVLWMAPVLLLLAGVAVAVLALRGRRERQAAPQALSAEDAQLFYQIAIKGRGELGQAPDPRTGLEMTLLRMLAFRPATGPATGGDPAERPASPRSKPDPAAHTGASSASPRGSARTQPVAPPAERSVLRPDPTPRPHPDPRPDPRPGPAGVPSQADSAPRTPPVPAAGPEPAVVPPRGDSDWLDLIERLGLAGQVRELARNIELTERAEHAWTFAIAPALKHLASRICISRLEQALAAELGHDLKVRIVEDGQAAQRTAAAAEAQQRSQDLSEAERAIADDPTVQALKEKMGARIVDDSIQPLQ